jgi:hypothetical protein
MSEVKPDEAVEEEKEKYFSIAMKTVGLIT